MHPSTVLNRLLFLMNERVGPEVEQEVFITTHNLLFHFSDRSKKMLHTFLDMNPAIDWSWSVTKSVTKLKAILQTLFEFIFIYF